MLSRVSRRLVFTFCVARSITTQYVLLHTQRSVEILDTANWQDAVVTANPDRIMPSLGRDLYARATWSCIDVVRVRHIIRPPRAF